MIRTIKALMVASIALLLSLAAWGNIVDHDANWHFIQHVLSMDTTFKDSTIMNRAIKDVELQRFAYSTIITWELITAIICWISSLWMLRSSAISRLANYKTAKSCAIFGLGLGFLLYMVVFIDLGGEWFAMWQSPKWNGQPTAGLFLTMIMLVLIFLSTPDHAE